MNTETLRKMLSEIPASKQYYTKMQFSDDIKSALKTIKNKKAACKEFTDSERWMVDNYDFIVSIGKSIERQRCKLRYSFANFLSHVILSDDFNASKDDVVVILNEADKTLSFKESELESMREAFLFVVLRAIAFAASEDESKIPHLIRSLHLFNQLDFQRIALSTSPLERILRLDPSGIYQKMTLETRALYREKIKRAARKKKISCETYAKMILDQASREKRHFGFYLKKKKVAHLYFPLVFLITAVLLFAIRFLTGSFAFSMLFFPMLYFSSKAIVDYLYSIFTKNEIIPALRCDMISEEEKTCVIITALIFGENDVLHLLSKLRKYLLNNKEDADEIYFGLLCDLPQSKEAKSESDQKIIECLHREIEKLTLEDQNVFAMLRSRVYHKSEDSFVGWERKRGAIHEFVRFLRDGKISESHYFFGNRSVIGSKYLITLDADTELGMGQARRLLGKMLHPLNRPIVKRQKNGTAIVKEGYGILQPQVAPSLLNKISTPFAKIYSNGSGRIPYASAYFDSMQSLFGEGNFCGKGIIDVEAYHTVLKEIIPEQKILSHDMPEGALLRCGAVLDEYFLDSDPQDAVSFDKRLHRWIRGDVQNVILYRLLPKNRRCFAVENLLSYWIPIFHFAILFFSAFMEKRIAVLGCSVVIAYEFLPLFREVFCVLKGGNIQLLGRRFQSRMRNRLLNAFYQCSLSLLGICHKAYYYSDAILRSAFRLIFSKKKLLEWQAYSPFSSGKKDPLSFYFPSILLAVIQLFFSHTVFHLLLSLGFIFYPFIMLALSEKYVEIDVLTKAEKQGLLEMAKKEFLYYSTVVNENSSFLPPDNIQFEPVEKIANRTSPTNIGLYLASLVSAADLGIISVKECLKSIEKALDHIEKMEHYQGHLYNWYDLTTLGVIGDRFISTVDSGNYVASLVIVSEALKEWNGVDHAAQLRDRIEKEILSANFKVLFDQEQNLFYVGIFPEEKQKTVSRYDLYMSEARITSFFAIATKQIQASHWYTTQRPVLSFLGRVGIGSWSGTCFEYFMPFLFLPQIDNSLEEESLNFAFFCQSKYYSSTEFGKLWGISESGHSQVDEAGNLQYKAFGVPFLSVQDKQNNPKIFSPYSTFLMLEKAGKLGLNNLRVFDKLGANGPMGFYEALEYNSNFINDFTIVKSYMAHHKGMSFLSLANVLCEKKNVERFMNRYGFRESVELLAERFPIEGRIYRKKKESIVRAKKGVGANTEILPIQEKATSGKILTDGKLSIVAYDNAENRVYYHSMNLFKPQSGGIRCRIISENEEISFQNIKSKNSKIRCTPLGTEYIWVNQTKSAVLKLAPVFSKNGLFLRLELNGFPEKCKVEIEFDPLLLEEREYLAHPAFCDLSMEASCDGSNLLIRRRGVDKHFEMKIFSPCKFKIGIGDAKEADSFENQMLFHHGVKMVFDFPSAENRMIPLVFDLNQNSNETFEECFDGAYNFTKSICTQAENKFNHLNQVCFSTRESEEMLQKLLLLQNGCRNYIFSSLKPEKIDSLWENGISGDWPIIAYHLNSTGKKEIKKLGETISAYKKLSLSCAFKFDLVILRPPATGYFDAARDEFADLVYQYQCDYLIGKHPGIHFISCNFEQLRRWQSISAFFIGDTKAILKFVPEKTVNVQGLFRQNSNVKRVGTFLQNGFEINKDIFDTNVPFSHIVSNGVTGFVCNQNSLGYTWYRNAGLNRLSKWNNLPDKRDGEKIYLKIDDTFYDLLCMANRVRYFDSLAIYNGKLLENEFSVIVTIADQLSVKAVSVLFSSVVPRNAKLFFSFIPCLGRQCDKNILVEMKERFVLIRPSIYTDYSFSAFVFAKNQTPAVFKNGERLFVETECKEENIFVLGAFSSESHFEYLNDELNQNIEEIICEKIQNKTRVDAAVHPLRFWLKYQVLHSRFLGRTGLYQSSGAYGFRDQLQDCLAFLADDPYRTKIHLIRCAAHQFREGDVLHWWHTIRNQNRFDPGIRSRCSDDYLWLIYVADEYICKTNDTELLNASIPFLIGDELKNNENEKYICCRTGEKGTMLEHLERAAKLFIQRGLGEHDLPPIGCGDWNDGMNLVDGESVWLGLFGAICLNRIKKYVTKSLSNEIDVFLLRLKKGILASHNGVWFCRAYRKNGQILGNDVTLESECSIDLITQAFSAFCFDELFGTEFALDERQVSVALKAAFDTLVDPNHSVIKLFRKPFVNFSPSTGYIQKYCAGVRENGGQYTHAAVWFGMALLKFAEKTNDYEFYRMAKKVKEMLDPMKNIHYDHFRYYQREPYVLCGDVYDANGFQGHGGWSWYTGAAGWFLNFIENLEKFEKNNKNKTGIE